MVQFLKFSTPNCQACKAMARYLESLSDIFVTEVDCTLDRNKEIVLKYGVSSVPTLVRLDTGEKVIGFSKAKVDELVKGV